MGASSTGCRTCKRRKVKCDETHPKCTRCNKAGVECTGFVPRLRFVDENPRIRRSVAVSYAQSHKFSTMAVMSPLLYHSHQTRRPQHLDPNYLLTDALPLTAFKDEIFITYLCSKLYKREYRDSVKCGLPTNWISELIETPQKPRYKSWDALAAIIFGQAHNSPGVITNAHGIYGEALSELRHELSNRVDRSTDSMLASITALYMYEILLFRTTKSWMLHADGLGLLLRLRGPWQQKSYAKTSIFLEHRIVLVGKSIIFRQSTFLRDPIWKTVPWEDDPTSKSAMDYLVDIGADMAEYNAQLKAYDNKSNQFPGYSQLRTQAATSLEELNIWWRQWEAENENSVREVTPHLTARDQLFSTLLEYDTLSAAFTVCMYNATRILLLQLWQRLQLFPSPTRTTNPDVILDTPNRTALLGITSDTKGLASEILRSLKYSYKKSRRLVFTFSFFFLRGVAYGCFDQGSQEAIWVAGRAWAELGNLDDIEDANLLDALLPVDRITCRRG